jgi:hypothetical protein
VFMLPQVDRLGSEWWLPGAVASCGPFAPLRYLKHVHVALKRAYFRCLRSGSADQNSRIPENSS